jgi:hypothetical protein
MPRKEFFKCSQAESQLVIVSVAPLDITKLGNAKVAAGLQFLRIFLTLCTPCAITSINPEVNDINGSSEILWELIQDETNRT